MSYFYLIMTIFLQSAVSILNAFYNRKNKTKKDSNALYSLILLCSVFASWVVMFATDRSADVKVIPYSLLFALGFAVSMITMVLALRLGPIILTSLIMQLSLIGTTIWGFFFWNDRFTVLVGVGLVLVVLALWLCLYTGKGEKQKISFKWLLCVCFMFIGNAICAIVQKTQQLDFNGRFGNFTMMVATGISVVFALILYLRSDKTDSAVLLKSSWYYPLTAGVLNALANLLVIILATSTLSPSLIYPVISVGVIALNGCFSAFVFKEKMRWWQWIGVAVGACAVVFLSV